jgi:hypothetical protein
MTKLKFKTHVRYNGTRYEKGQIESGFSENEVSLFVEQKVAFVVGVPDSSAASEGDSTGKETKTPDNPPDDTDKEAIYRELDENWNADELKVDAERIGMEFDAKKILKKDLIQLIIDSGRSDEFLSMLEDDTEE